MRSLIETMACQALSGFRRSLATTKPCRTEAVCCTGTALHDLGTVVLPYYNASQYINIAQPERMLEEH